MTDKLIRDGKVAVLVSPGWGAGWSTWALAEDSERAVFDPTLVRLIEAGDALETAAYCDVAFPKQYQGGLRDVVVYWVPVGTPFFIAEHDGNERLVTPDHPDWRVA